MLHHAEYIGCAAQEQQDWARIEAEMHEKVMAKHADLTTARILQQRAAAAAKPNNPSSSHAAAKPPPPFKSHFKLKPPNACSSAQQRQPPPWESDCRTWAIRDKNTGTVVVYKHDDGLMCPVPGSCRHEKGVDTFHG